MGIKVNPAAWTSAAFAMPTTVVDEHLRRASGQQLKVLLYALRHNGVALEEAQLAEGTGLSIEDVKDAAQYWIETGFLFRDGTAPAPVETTTTSSPKPAAKEVVELPQTVPSHDEVAARALEDPNIRGLFNEAQAKLGRTIGYSNQAKLLMMVDEYGLPPEVILTIIEYAVRHGKTSMSYISAVGKNWASEGVDSLEAAMDKLEQMDRSDRLWKEFQGSFTQDAPKYSDSRAAFVRKWRLEYKQSPELIHYAYEKMINQINKVNFSYMDKILESWHNDGLNSPVDVLQSEKKTGKSTAGKKSAPKNVSYDSEQYRKKAKGPIKYEPKNRDPDNQ